MRARALSCPSLFVCPACVATVSGREFRVQTVITNRLSSVDRSKYSASPDWESEVWEPTEIQRAALH